MLTKPNAVLLAIALSINAPSLASELSSAEEQSTVLTPSTVEFLILDIDLGFKKIENTSIYETDVGHFVPTYEFPVEALNFVQQKTYTIEGEECYRLDDFLVVELDKDSLLVKAKVRRETLIPEEFVEAPYLTGHPGLFINYRATANNENDPRLSYRATSGNEYGYFQADAEVVGDNHRIAASRYVGFLDDSLLYQIGNITWGNNYLSQFSFGTGIGIGTDSEFLTRQGIFANNSYAFATYAPADYALYRNGELLKRGKLQDDFTEIENVFANGIADYRLEVTDRYGDIQMFYPEFRSITNMIKKGNSIWNATLYQDDQTHENQLTSSMKYGLSDTLNAYGGAKIGEDSSGLDLNLRASTDIGIVDFNFSNYTNELANWGVNYQTQIWNVEMVLDYQKGEEERFSGYFNYSITEKMRLSGNYSKRGDEENYALSVRGSAFGNMQYSLGYNHSGNRGGSFQAYIHIPFGQQSVAYSRNDSSEYLDFSISRQKFSSNMSYDLEDQSYRTYAQYRSDTANYSVTHSDSGNGSRSEGSVWGTLSLSHKALNLSSANNNAGIFVYGENSADIETSSFGSKTVLTDVGGLVPAASRVSQSLCMDTNKKDFDFSLKEACMSGIVHRGYIGEYKLKTISGGVHVNITNLDDELPNILTLKANGVDYKLYKDFGGFVEDIESGIHTGQLYNGEQLICEFEFEAEPKYKEIQVKCEQ
mgnify:CR=1 FL=1|tara:strand:+ start:34399 stop:36519 length:2121 start_codon:yes stop_codon:yes gene_type:complete